MKYCCDFHVFITIILGPDALSDEETIGLQKVSLRKLNEHLNIFHVGGNLDHYKACAKKITLKFMRYVLQISTNFTNYQLFYHVSFLITGFHV